MENKKFNEECRVCINDNVYINNPPNPPSVGTNCVILCGMAVYNLMALVVFKGSYKDCEQYILLNKLNKVN